MEKLTHSVQINVFEKDQDKIQTINECYHFLLPVDYTKEGIEIIHENLEGFHQMTIHSLTLSTTKNKHNNLLLNNIFTSINKQDLRTIINQLESRINDDGNLYIRLDKESLLKKRYQLIDHGNCFHIKIKLAAFPAKKENFMNTAQRLLQLYLAEDF